MYAQADLRLCWSHIPHCWKSHTLAHVVFFQGEFISKPPSDKIVIASKGTKQVNSSKEPLQKHRELKFHKESEDIYEFEDESPTVVKIRNIDKQFPGKKRKLTHKVVKKTEANKNENAVVSKNTKENAVVSKNAKENVVVRNNTKENAVVSKNAKENAVVRNNTKENAVVSKNTYENAVVSKNAKENAVVSKNTKENAVVSKNTKENAVISNSAKGGNAVEGMIAEENAIFDISAGKDRKSVSSCTKKGTARGDNAVVIPSTSKDNTVTSNSSRRDNVVSINAKKDNFARRNNASASHYIGDGTVFDINSKQPINNKEIDTVIAHKARQSTLSNHSTIPAKKLSGGFRVTSLLREQTEKDKNVQNIKAKSVVKEICSLMNSEFSCPKTKSFCWQYFRDISVCYTSTSLPIGTVLTLYTQPTHTMIHYIPLKTHFIITWIWV